MKLTLSREELLNPLQLSIGVVERRQTLPILSNVLINVQDTQLTITGTDLEVELIGRSELQSPAEIGGEITVPGRKLFDICKTLPESSQVTLELDGDRMRVRSGRSRFSLSTLPAQDFPRASTDDNATELTIPQKELLFLLQRTHFAMAQQDVRYYLNGMFLEVKPNTVSTVATDGHRLALNTINVAETLQELNALLPYKGVQELMRLLADNEDPVTLFVSQNHLRADTPRFTFTTKLIDGSFPSYERVLPKACDKTVNIDRNAFKQTLQRASILSNEKFRGIRLQLDKDLMSIQANNPEQEEAQEDLNVEYAHDALELGFNVDYIIDVLNTVDNDTVTLSFANNESGVLIEQQGENANSTFVVMPLRL